MKGSAFSLLVIAALAGGAVSRQPVAATSEARGQAIVASHCASCHAIGASGDSAAPEAPPFRLLSRNYRIASLEEALAEGISVGRPAMPEFQFSPDDVDSVVAYLQSVQESDR